MSAARQSEISRRRSQAGASTPTSTSSSMKRSSAETSTSPEELVSNLRSLLSEAEKLVGESAGEYASDKMSELYNRLQSAQERVQELYGVAREKVAAGAQTTDRTIRSHPYESLAIALGIGVLLGALLRRNSNH
ncbi:MAG: hypothetical protein C0518_13345 [Opitutus sp.]|nr:hypothetical protein [Opitutus sp.]